MAELMQGLLSLALSRMGKGDDETVMKLLEAAMAVANIEAAAQLSGKNPG